MQKTVLGADIGGSHITAAVIDPVTRSIVEETLIRKKVDAHAPVSTILETWTSALVDAQEAWGKPCTDLSVSMPGPFDYENGISWIKGMNKYEALYGFNVKQAFAERIDLPTNRVRFLNDAEAFLRGELMCSDLTKKNRVLGLTLGTGLGAAFFNSGAVKDLNLGSSRFLEGIAEDYISTRGILTCYRSLGGEGIHDIKSLADRIPGDVQAEDAMGQLAYWLADFLLIHLPELKPDAVIIGGNISKAYRLFLPDVTDRLAARQILVPIRVAMMGEQAALLGAASLINS
ncbi:ROK family protein [Olivibacter sp. XZL3]|uniref:ROK family protein n=1 Tax=Olivibacter sp. XZL3 TaxID=1735116 RepID=UPI001066B434|nr:ROK family protein [Olivibacter sp. XZL3]